MSSLIFAHAKSIRNKAKKYASSIADMDEALGKDYKTSYEESYNQIVRNETNEFKEILYIAQELHGIYKETIGLETSNWYFITIRPDEKLTNFIEFKSQVEKYVKRKCFIDYTLTYEQKGTSNENLGSGYHCHIVAYTSWRSKGEALRDTKSTFNKICAPNCIEIKPTRNPNDIIQNYMIDYKSDDNHKIETKIWDDKWRIENKLKNIYNKNDISLSSPYREISFNTDPKIIEWN